MLLICSDFVEMMAMTHKFKNLPFWTRVAFCSMTWMIVACGNGEPDFLGAPPGDLPVVRLAGEGEQDKAESRPGSYLVMFRDTSAKSNLYFASFAAEFTHHYGVLSKSYLSDPRIRDIDVLSAVDMTGLRSPDWEPEFSLPKALSYAFSSEDIEASNGVLTRVDFVDESAAEDVLEEWDNTGRIWFAEPNEISRLSTNDSMSSLAEQYKSKTVEWHKQIRVAEGFAAIAGNLAGAVPADKIYADPPVIAVVDSGVDYEHPQLKDNIWQNPQVGAAGCVDDVHGCNTAKAAKGRLGNGEVWPVLADGPGVECDANNPNPEQRKCDHGTHVAGIIAAKPRASWEVAGACPMCKIMILRVTEVDEGEGGSGDPMILDDSQIRAYKYLTRFRKSGGSAVRVVNASFGKYSRSRSLAILVDVLKRVGSGTLVIGAASNEDAMIRSYPAAFANAIAVASVGASASDSSVRKSSFSNFGPWVDIAAPGCINSTVSGGSNVRVMSGTSMASPVVAGAAGLLLAAYPNLSFLELRERILKGANAAMLYGSEVEGGDLNAQYYYPKIAGETARRPLLGGGLVDAEAMLKGSGNFATGQPVERVTAGCSVIGVGSGSNGLGSLLIFCLVLPLLASIMALSRRRG